MKIKLILSDDIELHLGLVDKYQTMNENFEVFKKKILHFMHLNVNSFLHKIDELRYIAKISKALTETKLINTFLNLRSQKMIKYSLNL